MIVNASKVMFWLVASIVVAALGFSAYRAADEVRMLAHDTRNLVRQAVEGVNYDRPILTGDGK